MDTASYRFLDEAYYAVRDFRLEDIEVPLLSVANWVRNRVSQSPASGVC